MVKMGNTGYEYVSDRSGLTYSLLEGKIIGTNDARTSDILFIFLDDPDYNVENRVVGYLYGANTFDESCDNVLKRIVDKYEEKEGIKELEKRSHKSYEKNFLGSSDYAFLFVVGYVNGKGMVVDEISYGGDGIYQAYIVDEKCDIPPYYELAAEFEKTVKIYDDDECVARYTADRIKIYRAGDYGTIIQLLN